MANVVSTLNLSAFSAAELSALLTAAKSEILRRISSAGQSYGMTLYSTAELNQLVNALTDALNLDTTEIRVRPNFTHNCSTQDGVIT